MTKDQKGKTFLKVVFFVCLATITVLSLIPSPEIDISKDISDKFMHFMAYFITTALLCFAFRPVRISLSLIYGLLIFFYSIAIEIFQYFLPYRTCSLGDMIANLSGILSFIFPYVVYIKKNGLRGMYRNTFKVSG
ncbi:MAG: VanZ family protein [Nitrospirae bacterium]|nr:VanZ family protein [Nitrospirota bacterium]